MNDLMRKPSDIDRQRMAPEFVRNIALDVILALVTCGIWNIYLQSRQMRAVNFMIGHQKYSFIPWALLTLVTCGLWHIYHEYRLSKDIAWALNQPQSNDPIVHLLLSIFGLSIVTDALQQAEINGYFGNHAL